MNLFGSSYESDRNYGERFLPLVKNIVGPHLLRPSPFEVDAKQATDLIVLRAEAVDIGVRVRRPGYYERYPNDVTFRSKRDSGAETELGKVVKNGWMTWFFYGHGNSSSEHPKLVAWKLIDMRVWRGQLALLGWQEAKRREMVISNIPNGDGTYFCACDVTKWPAEMIIDSSDKRPANNVVPMVRS